MVKGLNVFRERFQGFGDRYVVIGGGAVETAMDAAALPFRVTKDLDVVLHVESLDAEFAKAFWAFVTDGCYEFKEKSTGKSTLYRFSKPTDGSFPFMLELFSRRPELRWPARSDALLRLIGKSSRVALGRAGSRSRGRRRMAVTPRVLVAAPALPAAPRRFRPPGSRWVQTS